MPATSTKKPLTHTPPGKPGNGTNEALVKAAHATCPDSGATRGDVPVTLNVI